jgi:electron-transferring-flavoprotein dehydrogenase
MKRHPDIQKYLKEGECISYGARTLNEGSYFAIPKLTFPGGMMVGCSAGLLTITKIKGSHNAMKSGIEAAKAIY